MTDAHEPAATSDGPAEAAATNKSGDPSVPQGSFENLRVRMNECAQAVQQALTDAIKQDLGAANDASLARYQLAVDNLDASQHAVTTAATRLAVAEQALKGFYTTMALSARNDKFVTCPSARGA